MRIEGRHRQPRLLNSPAAELAIVGAVAIGGYAVLMWLIVLTAQERRGLVALGRELTSRRLTAR